MKGRLIGFAKIELLLSRSLVAGFRAPQEQGVQQRFRDRQAVLRHGNVNAERAMNLAGLLSRSRMTTPSTALSGLKYRIALTTLERFWP